MAGRPSVRTERRAEILGAFAELANEQGLHNCSLRAIAERVGVTMPLLLHHFGSRDELVGELIALVTEQVREGYATEGFFSFDGDAGALVDFFFDGGFRKLVSDSDALFADLLAASNRDPSLRRRFRDLYRALESVISKELELINPSSSSEERKTVAYALVCLLESNEMFLRMGFRDGRSARAQAAATTMIASLGSVTTTVDVGEPKTSETT